MLFSIAYLYEVPLPNVALNQTRNSLFFYIFILSSFSFFGFKNVLVHMIKKKNALKPNMKKCMFCLKMIKCTTTTKIVQALPLHKEKANISFQHKITSARTY